MYFFTCTLTKILTKKYICYNIVRTVNTQTITQIGNSDGVTIPAHLMTELHIKRGQKVIVDRLADTDNLVIITKPQKKTSKSALSKEFHDWLESFLEEDKEILDELAHR